MQSLERIVPPITRAERDRHLLAVAMAAAGCRDRDNLAIVACREAATALDGWWAVMGYFDAEGALIAGVTTKGFERGGIVATPTEVAQAGLARKTGPVRFVANVDGEPQIVDAVLIDPQHRDSGLLAVGRFADGHLTYPDLPAQERCFLSELGRLLNTAFERMRAEAEVALNEQRLADAQELARLGSYDWTIATDTNVWSDELYRIYGHAPGAFNASYERFLALVHPDDRERIVAVHTKAMQDHQPYRMEERIVRPDGEVRILDSSGKIVLDHAGRPARMVGICLDVTEQRKAAAALDRSQARFRTLIDSAPDAVIVVDASGTIVQANRETTALFGWSADELCGHFVDAILPRQADTRMRDGVDVLGRRRDGSIVAVDVKLAVIETESGPATAAFVRDASERQRVAEAHRQLAQADEQRRQALEINDNVVQGLATIVWSIESGVVPQALDAARHTLASASSMMSQMLSVSDAQLVAGDLVRSHAAPSQLRPPLGAPKPDVVAPAAAAKDAAQKGARALTVLLADDSDDVRLLYRVILEGRGMTVVAEAADGVEAVRLAELHHPDIALIDLAMPLLDGLQATAAIKKSVPACHVAVLSGFEESRVGGQALAAGADRYLCKGIASEELVAELIALGATP